MYTQKGTLSRDEAVRRHAPLVRRMAHHLIARLPANVELDDVIQAGMMGLLDAIQRYEEHHGAQFETYAAQRIRGAMLDALRSHDWLPRGVRRAQRRIDRALQALEHRLGREPTESEIAAELRLSLDEYRRLLEEARGTQLLFYEDLAPGSEDEREETDTPDLQTDPLARLEDRRFREALVAAIERLPERERQVMGMYYEQELTLKEIAAVLGVTESRVCQIHAQAIARLRARLKGW
ncbi:MAG: RNA polymerase sigma factor FliA [Burkholderiales bacterium]|nr:RNA polymerase sigma factor FliA [Burkholderiales bacterium]